MFLFDSDRDVAPLGRLVHAYEYAREAIVLRNGVSKILEADAKADEVVFQPVKTVRICTTQISPNPRTLEP